MYIRFYKNWYKNLAVGVRNIQFIYPSNNMVLDVNLESQFHFMNMFANDRFLFSFGKIV